ncbi:MAG TPA: hypothetical protein VF037_01180 [Gemmatimonadales bacterium]
MSHRRFMLAAGLAILPACAGCGADSPTNPETALVEGAALTRMPGDPGAAADRLFYKVNLRPQGDSRATGVALIEIVGGYLRVRIHAAGVEPGEHIPQHIHLNPGCNPGGGILVNLDAGLTVPVEGPGTGAAYPVANAAGVMNYEATRSLDDLRAAFNTYAGTDLGDTAELLAHLNLEERNAHMHVAFGPPFPAVNCGEVERIN